MLVTIKEEFSISENKNAGSCMFIVDIYLSEIGDLVFYKCYQIQEGRRFDLRYNFSFCNVGFMG